MDREQVREHAQAVCDALLAGNIERALEEFSDALRTNPGQLVAQLPLPLTEAIVEGVDPSPTGFVAVLKLVGETQTVEFQTRWKDRDGAPTVVEASHVVEQPVAEAEAEGDSP